MKQLEAGHSETLAAYLGTMARFHNYSFGNILQIARQRPTATRVAGFSAWKELGRFVKRGEKGIQILAPVTGYRRRKDEAEGETDSKPQPVLMGFRAVYVFDYAQTEGVDLPELEHTIGGEVGSNRDRLVAFLAQQNIALELTRTSPRRWASPTAAGSPCCPVSRRPRSSPRWYTRRRTYVVFAVMLRSGCEGASSLGLLILDTT
jgi:hypothetical protein